MTQAIRIIIGLVVVVFGSNVASFAGNGITSLVHRYIGNDAQSYKYGGKELYRMEGMNLYDFHARSQSATTLTFITPDPKLEDYPGISPYAYCAGNPIMLIDPTGLYPIWNGKYGEDCLYIDSETNAVVTPEEVVNYINTGNYSGINELGTPGSIPNNEITPFQLGLEWLTGTGERHRIFTCNDSFTRQLKSHPEFAKIKKIITQLLREYRNKRKLKITTGEISRNLRGISGIIDYVKDYATLFTFGKTGNLATTFLGSFFVSWSIISIQGNTANVLFEVKNSSTAASAFRPPILGYTKLWNATVGKCINNIFEEGEMSETSQTIIWTEQIQF